MKIKKRAFQKVITIFASFFLLINSFAPFLLITPAFGQVKAQTETATPAIESTLTPTSEPTPTFTPVPIPTQAPSNWTFEKIELSKEYVAPQNSEVKLIFTKLPIPTGNIKIEEITLTDDQIKQTGSLTNKAYDITSDMKDGDFSYNLSLPIPELSKGKQVEVKFTEELSNIDSAKKVVNSLTKTDTSVSVTSLNHMTIFVVTGTIDQDEFGNLSATYVPDASNVVINEFIFDPSSGNEWVELYNTASSPSSDLGGWTIKDRDETNTDITIPLGTVIPANGILVFENNSSGWLDNVGVNTNGDTITLRNSGDTIMSQVTYQQRPDGTIFINGQASTTTYSGQGQSIGRVINESGITWQAYSTPTKGWFNDAGETGKAPTLSSIDSTLVGIGIASNIGELNNPSATPDNEAGGALYFEKSGYGKIVFEKTLNLSDQDTVSVMQTLGTAMSMSNGHMKFDSDTADKMKATGAKIYMYGLSYATTPDIIVKNDAGETLGTNDPSAVSGINYDPDLGKLSFTALHFTQFDLPAIPSSPVLHDVPSPTNNTTPTLSWDDVSSTPEVTSYDVEIDDSGGNNIYDSYITTTSSSFTPDEPLPGDDDYTWYVRANNAVGSSDEWSEGSFTLDTVSPNVGKLGDGLSDAVLEVGDSHLSFSEILSDSSKTAVENALTAGADKTLTYVWNDNSLIITATQKTTFANDVVVDIEDLAGNKANSLLLVDSKLSDTQISPDGKGNVTADSDTPEVVVTDPDQEVTVNVDGTTEATIDVSSFITDRTGDIPQITINSVNADVSIPATTVTGPAGWDGMISAPSVTTIDLPVVSGETSTLASAIEIGFSENKLSFDNAVRILLPGQAGKRAGYSRPGTPFTEITNICSSDSQYVGDALSVDGECKIDVGVDLIIWTKHFTKFAAYTQTTNTTSSSNSSSSSSSGTSNPSAPVCNDQKPGSAPTLLSAVSGVNSVTLTWAKANDPVSYYLVTFGTKAGEQLYGNPNVGGSETTSYTINNLSGGKTYYFKVRAGNGCMPGDYSNERSGNPSGGFIAGIPGGFAPGVLGTQTQITPTSAPTGQLSPSLVQKQNPVGNAQHLNFFQRIWNFILGLFRR